MANRISEKSVIIRKQRKCFGCLRIIEKGKTAYIQTYNEDDKFHNLTLCQTCKDKTAKMRYDEEFCEGELQEAADD